MRKKLSLLFIAIIIVVIAAPVASAADFSTKEYNVNIDVKKDKSLYVTENIGIDVHGAIHGIYRYIPLNKEMTYNNELGELIKVEKNFIKISDISVAKDPFEDFVEKGNAVIKIGDPDKYVTEKSKTYTLSYKVTMYDEKVKDYDAFIYNVIPQDWETPIEKAVVNITFPENIDKETIDVYAGKYGTKSSGDKVKWNLEGNTITIETKGALEQGEGITLGVKLKDGYFKGAPSMTWPLRGLGIASLLMGAIVILLWYKYGRDPKSVHTVEFYPPEGISPAEVGYIIDERVEKRDVTSLIFYFAEKGYLTIEADEKKDFTLRKIGKLPADAKGYEKVFFNGLFNKRDEVNIRDLGSDFHLTYSATVEMIEDYFKGNREEKIFSPKAIGARAATFLLMALGLGGVGLLIAMLTNNALPFVGVGIISIVLFFSYVVSINAFDSRYSKGVKSKFASNTLAIVTFAVAVIITFFFIEWITGSLLVALCYVIMEGAGFFATRYMQARTKHGAKLLGQILGFKEFIKVAEAEKLEMLIEERPEYFYNVLPYAYVMGISKKWAKKFEEINVEPPSWYTGTYDRNNIFNSVIFYSSFRNCMNASSEKFNIPDSNFGGGSSGGFGGGGGFSGGGFGGGGGGSW